MHTRITTVCVHHWPINCLTAILRKLCLRRPEGIVYDEIFDRMCLAQDLGKTARMIQHPRGIIDLVFTYVTQKSYAQYHVLPPDETAVAYVLDAIGEQACKNTSWLFCSKN